MKCIPLSCVGILLATATATDAQTTNAKREAVLTWQGKRVIILKSTVALLSRY